MQSKAKVVLIARTDLNMSSGKLAAQVGHAVEMAVRNNVCSEVLTAYADNGYAKIVLGCADIHTILDIERQAKDKSLPTARVVDEGRTEVPSGSVTVVAIGPSFNEDVDQITKSLSLYKDNTPRRRRVT